MTALHKRLPERGCKSGLTADIRRATTERLERAVTEVGFRPILDVDRSVCYSCRVLNSSRSSDYEKDWLSTVGIR